MWLGAGIGGLVQALSPKNSGLKVAVIDSQPPSQSARGEPLNRVSALNVSSKTYYRPRAFGGDSQQRKVCLLWHVSVGAR